MTPTTTPMPTVSDAVMLALEWDWDPATATFVLHDCGLHDIGGDTLIGVLEILENYGLTVTGREPSQGLDLSGVGGNGEAHPPGHQRRCGARRRTSESPATHEGSRAL